MPINDLDHHCEAGIKSLLENEVELPGIWLKFARRDLRSGCEVNWLINGLGGER